MGHLLPGNSIEENLLQSFSGLPYLEQTEIISRMGCLRSKLLDIQRDSSNLVSDPFQITDPPTSPINLGNTLLHTAISVEIGTYSTQDISPLLSKPLQQDSVLLPRVCADSASSKQTDSTTSAKNGSVFLDDENHLNSNT